MDLYRVMSILKLKIDMILPQLLCFVVLRLEMANFNDLVSFGLTVTTRHIKETRVESSFSTAPAPSRFSPRN